MASSSFKHKYLLMFGPSNKRVEVQNNDPEGATKEELFEKAEANFPLDQQEFIMQVWDEGYGEYCDITCERVGAPVKIRIVQVFPVQISADLLNSASSSIVTLDEFTPSVAETESNRSAETESSMDTNSELSEPEVRLEPDEAVQQGMTNTPATASAHSEEGCSSGAVPEAAPLRAVSMALVHFRLPTPPPSIEKKLRDGSLLNLPERGIFLQTIYDAVVGATGSCLPTKMMYDEIINQMFTKYPSLAHPQPNMPIGNMKTLWKDRLLYKFRNNRRRSDQPMPEVQAKRKKTVTESSTGREWTLRQWGMPMYLPSRPPSEDDGTIRAHEEFLRREKKKRQPDFPHVKLAMDKTLSDRRQYLVMTQPRPSLSAVKERYPWLFDEDQLTAEMMRLQDTLIPVVRVFKEALGKYASALLTKGQGVKKPPKCFLDSLALISTHRIEKERQDATCKAAFLILPKLLREDLNHIFVAPNAVTDNPVHLKMNAEDILDSTEFILMADGEEITTSNSFFDAVALWLSSYYVFNLEYQKVTRTLCFTQRIILQIDDQLQIPKGVSTLTNSLNQINLRK